ncbi:MAG: hypothetical protein LBL52_02435 [Rickettsiales bacterium]|jgi:hypothetical protein|nr:hypothetical protein [Rickettsiales bacterium]
MKKIIKKVSIERTIDDFGDVLGVCDADGKPVLSDSEKSEAVQIASRLPQLLAGGGKNREAVKEAIGRLSVISKKLDAHADHWNKFQGYRDGADIKLSQFALAEQSRPMAERLGEFLPKKKRLNPVLAKLGEAGEGIVKFFNHNLETIVLVAIVGGIIEAFVLPIANVSMHEADRESYVKSVAPAAIVLEDGKTIGRRSPLSLAAGDLVIYKDDLFSKPRAVGGQLYNRRADGSVVEIGKRLQGMPGYSKGNEKSVVNKLLLEEQILLLTHNPDAIIEALAARPEDESDSVKVAEAVLALKRQARVISERGGR